MKKIIALFLALIMVFSLVACTSGAETTTETKTPAETTGSTETTSTEAPAETEAKGGYTVAMLPKFKGENYFDGCYKGAQQAADDAEVAAGEPLDLRKRGQQSPEAETPEEKPEPDFDPETGEIFENGKGGKVIAMAKQA